jgi:hypothetical protein
MDTKLVRLVVLVEAVELPEVIKEPQVAQVTKAVTLL